MQNKRGKNNFLKQKNRGQVTIFIIIAILIVAGVVIFFIVSQSLVKVSIPANIQPVYNDFISCLEDRTNVGIGILESQGGYIQLPAFEKGSSYSPFSSQLNFFGNPIPYWYYVSENNINKEQIPTVQDMEKSLGQFINAGIRNCNFDNYYQEGFVITQGTPTAIVSINANNVNVNLNMNFQVSFGNDTALVQNHNAVVKSNLGELYNSAQIVYQKEKSESFLENYGIDSLRLYAPVDGVDLTCSPDTWMADNVFANLSEAIETNTLALSNKAPTTSRGKYFYVNIGTNDGVRFVNSRTWPHSFEVNPSQGPLMIANPVGNQQGLGILGFCYVPYHFVYNVKYPVLIQVYNGDEIFQFPVAVVIAGNKPRVALNSIAGAATSTICPYNNTPTTVQTFDSNLNPINANISYECFGETCNLGDTSAGGSLTTDFPQCENGYIVADSNGYSETRYLYSTTSQGSASIVLNKLYKLNIALTVDGANYNGNAIISFSSEGNSGEISYPQQSSIDLSEGDYNISVYIYKNSSIQFQQTTSQQCTNIPSSGIGGLFGLTQQKCFDVTIPSQVISNALAGGGQQESYFLESQLENSTTIELDSKGLKTPTTIQDIENNYQLFGSNGLGVSLK